MGDFRCTLEWPWKGASQGVLSGFAPLVLQASGSAIASRSHALAPPCGPRILYRSHKPGLGLSECLWRAVCDTGTAAPEFRGTGLACSRAMRVCRHANEPQQLPTPLHRRKNRRIDCVRSSWTPSSSCESYATAWPRRQSGGTGPASGCGSAMRPEEGGRWVRAAAHPGAQL